MIFFFFYLSFLKHPLLQSWSEDRAVGQAPETKLLFRNICIWAWPPLIPLRASIASLSPGSPRDQYTIHQRLGGDGPILWSRVCRAGFAELTSSSEATFWLSLFGRSYLCLLRGRGESNEEQPMSLCYLSSLKANTGALPDFFLFFVHWTHFKQLV